MALIGHWGERVFEVSPQAIRSFNDLKIKVSSDTETVTTGGQQYMKWKNLKATEITLTVQLRSGLGYDVANEAYAWIGDALAKNKKNYFYLNDGKLMPYPLLLTDATVSNIDINAAGIWTGADVALTLKQAALLDGSSGSGGGGGGGGSGSGTPQKQSVTPARTTTAKTVASALPQAVTNAVNSAVATINRIVNAARNASASSKPATGSGGGKTVSAVK